MSKTQPDYAIVESGGFHMLVSEIEARKIETNIEVFGFPQMRIIRPKADMANRDPNLSATDFYFTVSFINVRQDQGFDRIYVGGPRLVPATVPAKGKVEGHSDARYEVTAKSYSGAISRALDLFNQDTFKKG